jgi:hypothetical protein
MSDKLPPTESRFLIARFVLAVVECLGVIAILALLLWWMLR